MVFTLLSIITIGTISIVTSAAPWDDVLLILYKSELLFNGSHLYRDIVDINSPIIFYYNYPAIIINKLTQIPLVLSLKTYTAIVVGIILMISYKILSIAFRHESRKVIYTLQFVITLIFYFSWSNYIQRDYLITAFSMPYCLLMMSYLLDGTSHSKGVQMIAGILLGVGIMIKPMYIIIPLIAETAALIRYRDIKHIFSVVNISHAATLFLIVTLFYINFPQYFNVMLQAAKYYYYYKDTFSLVGAGFSIFGLIIFLIAGSLLYFNYKTHNPSTMGLCTIYLFMFIGILVVYLQHKLFPYHFYFFMIFSTLFSIYIVIRKQAMVLKNFWAQLYVTTSTVLLAIFILAFDTVVPVSLAYANPIPSDGPYIENYFDQAGKYINSGSYAVLSGCIWPYGNMYKVKNVKNVMRYFNLWFLPGIYKNSSENIMFNKIDKMSHDEKEFFINVVYDIVDHKPNLIIVHNDTNDCGFEHKAFDYIKYYSMNEDFKKMLELYEEVDSGNSSFKFYHKISE